MHNSLKKRGYLHTCTASYKKNFFTVLVFFFQILQEKFRLRSLTNKGNNKITELRTILQRESQNS